MKLNVYAFYDKDNEEFCAPMVSKNDKTMIKSIKNSVMRDSSRLDFDSLELYLIGQFDTEDGTLFDIYTSSYGLENIKKIDIPDFFADETGDKEDDSSSLFDNVKGDNK